MKIFASAALAVATLACATGAFAQAPTPRTIAIGETVQGVLEKGDMDKTFEWIMDAFDLSVTKGQRVTITVKSDAFDSYIDFDKGEDHIDANDDADDDLNAQLVVDIEETGVYRINVTSSEHTELGAYALSVKLGGELAKAEDDEPAIDLAEPSKDTKPAPPPAPIRMGQTVRGRLSDTSPLHDDDTPYQGYGFAGKRGQSVSVEMKSKDFDPYLVLVRKGYSSAVKSDDDGGDGSDAHLLAVLPADGDYEIRANAVEETSRGDFTLSLAEGPARVAAVPVAITYGQTVRGELKEGDAQDDDGSWFDVYRLRGRAGDKVTVTLLSDDFDAFLAMTVANGGREIASNDDGETDTDATLEVTLPADAEYDIRANTLTVGEDGRYVIGVSLAPR